MKRTRRVFTAYFEHEGDVLEATEFSREHGLRIVDAYTPYAVHGLDKAMGLKASKLTWVAFSMGLLGAALMLYFEFWTSAISWPINVGGKPMNSVPAFVPISFEIMVLFAGVGVVLALFIARRMFPGKRPEPLYEGATDDRFVLVLEQVDSTFHPEEVQDIFKGSFNAVKIEESVMEPSSSAFKQV